MILTRVIEMKITESSFSYYEKLGYDISIGEIIDIPVDILSKSSHRKIQCKCDDCGVVKDVVFKNYVKYKKKKWGEYYCRKCSEGKRKKTLKKNFGVEYPIQNKIIRKNLKKKKK